MILLATLHLWDWRQRQRKLKDLIAADWRRCTRCFFDLTGLGEQGTCPECGKQFVADEVREWWKVAMAAEQEAASRED